MSERWRPRQAVERMPGPPVLYSGSEVADRLTVEQKYTVAFTINRNVIQKPHTMLQCSPKQLLESMDAGRSAVALGPGNRVEAFAQVWELDIDRTKDPLFSKPQYADRTVYEAGSWWSDGLYGTPVFDAVINLGNSLDDNGLVIAVAEENNARAITKLRELGGRWMETRKSSLLKERDGERPGIKIYNMTDFRHLAREERKAS